MAVSAALRKTRGRIPDTVSALRALLGDRLSTSPSVLERHGSDLSYHKPAPPDAVAFARSRDEVVRIDDVAQYRDPDRVLARLDRFVSAYGARAVLFETWSAHPSMFELLLMLFDRSEFLAETAIRTPDLVDELRRLT